MKKYNVEVDFDGVKFLYTDVWFIDSTEALQEYMQIFNNRFKVSEEEINTIKSFVGHGHSYLTGLSGMFCGMRLPIGERDPMLLHLKYLQASALTSMASHILKGDKLAINELGGMTPIKADQEYTIECISGDKYSRSDIKTNKWWGGKHYYAKVGKIDVVDDYGNCKWNTEQYAYDMAVKFMDKLNNNEK